MVSRHLICIAMQREVNLAYINSDTDGSGRDGKASSGAGAVNSNNSNGGMSKPTVQRDQCGPLSRAKHGAGLTIVTESKSALLGRIDSSFQLASQGRDAQDNLSINPFLGSITTAAKHTRVIRYKADMKKKRLRALPASLC